MNNSWALNNEIGQGTEGDKSEDVKFAEPWTVTIYCTRSDYKTVFDVSENNWYKLWAIQFENLLCIISKVLYITW